jgi:hypothetical protein
MNSKLSVILSVALALFVSWSASAQTGVIGAKSDSAAGTSANVRLLLNQDPFPYLEMKTQIVEILAGGINVLATSNLPELSPSGPVESVRAKTAGSNGLLGLWVDNEMITIRTNLLQLNMDGIVLELTVTNSAKTVLASRKLAMRNYEEAMVELATAANGRRLAVRFLPVIKELPALRDFPSLLPQFGSARHLVIRNSKEVVSRGGTVGKIDDLTGARQQFITLESVRSGLLILSYRPFPGAVVAGYSTDRELRFGWNGDNFEWISLDKPFLPEGRWAIYAWQAGPSSRATEGVSFGCFEADPNDLPNFLSQRANQKWGIGGAVKK